MDAQGGHAQQRPLDVHELSLKAASGLLHNVRYILLLTPVVWHMSAAPTDSDCQDAEAAAKRDLHTARKEIYTEHVHEMHAYAK